MSMDPYKDGNIPPWDIGKPQPRLVEAYNQGLVSGYVLDIACGSGENALFFASKGIKTCGTDIATTGIEKARSKAKERGLEDHIEFDLGDAFNLKRLNRTFDTVIDSGFLHGRTEENKKKVVEEVRSVLSEGGNYVILGFHEDIPLGRGPPNRLKRQNFEELFAEGWELTQLEESHFHSNLPTSPHKAYFAVAKRKN